MVVGSGICGATRRSGSWAGLRRHRLPRPPGRAGLCPARPGAGPRRRADPAAPGAPASRRRSWRRVGVSLRRPRQPALRPEPLPPERRDVHACSTRRRSPSSGSTSSWGWPSRECWRPGSGSVPRSLRGARIGLYVALGLAGCFVASHLVFAWAEARYYMPVTAFTRYLPLYYPLNARHTQLKLGLLDRSARTSAAVVSALGRPPDGVLNYPLAPLAMRRRARRCSTSSRRDRRHARRRLDARGRAAARRSSRAAPCEFDRHYSGGQRVAGRDVLALLRTSRPVLGRLRRRGAAPDRSWRCSGCTAISSGRSSARPIYHGDRARSDGAGPRAESASARRTRHTRRRPQREGPADDGRVARVARPAGPVAAVLGIALLQRRGGHRPAERRAPHRAGRARGAPSRSASTPGT